MQKFCLKVKLIKKYFEPKIETFLHNPKNLTMKNLFLMIFLICFQMLFSQNSSFEHEKTAHFIKIWGLMKYQHPEVSKGKFAFDEAFVLQYQKMTSIHNAQIWNETMLEWILQFENSKTK